MKIRSAKSEDLDSIRIYDIHISALNLKKCILEKRVYVMEDEMGLIGCLRYGYLYDSYPFLNLIYLKDSFRRKGYGTLLMDRWESDMKNMGYNIVYTSTQVNENAQHFYRKRGYEDVGGFRPYGQEALELILCKRL